MGQVLLTGATGFVGRAVLAGLRARGHAPICVVRSGTAGRLEGAGPVIETPDLFAESADWWADACADVDMVIHLAWYAEPGKYLTSDRNLDCLTGTLALARGAARAGVRRLVGTGTCFEYDLNHGRLSPLTPLAPLTPYAAAKAATFTVLGPWLAQAGIGFLWARLFYLFGEGEDARRLVPYLHQQLSRGAVADLSSGTQVRDFMDVRNAAELLLSDAFSARTGATNICSGEGITVRALAERIADGYGRRDLLNFGARPDNLTDPPVVIGLRGEST